MWSQHVVMREPILVSIWAVSGGHRCHAFIVDFDDAWLEVDLGPACILVNLVNLASCCPDLLNAKAVTAVGLLVLLAGVRS